MGITPSVCPLSSGRRIMVVRPPEDAGISNEIIRTGCISFAMDPIQQQLKELDLNGQEVGKLTEESVRRDYPNLVSELEGPTKPVRDDKPKETQPQTIFFNGQEDGKLTEESVRRDYPNLVSELEGPTKPVRDD